MIQVFKHNTDTQLGKGKGTVNSTTATASITSWTVQAALQVGTAYKLKCSGVIYANANCTGNGMPATFDNVV